MDKLSQESVDFNLNESKPTGINKDRRFITVFAPDKVTQITFQQVGDHWVPYKKQVFKIH